MHFGNGAHIVLLKRLRRIAIHHTLQVLRIDLSVRYFRPLRLAQQHRRRRRPKLVAHIILKALPLRELIVHIDLVVVHEDLESRLAQLSITCLFLLHHSSLLRLARLLLRLLILVALQRHGGERLHQACVKLVILNSYILIGLGSLVHLNRPSTVEILCNCLTIMLTVLVLPDLYLLRSLSQNIIVVNVCERNAHLILHVYR